MAPFLPIRALNRSSAVRINNQKILPGTTYWIDLGATGAGGQPVTKELAYHSAIGQVYVVGPLSYRNGAGFILSSALTANSASIATTETLALNLAIPANFLAVGSVLDIEAMGTATASTATTMTANVRLGTVGTVAGDTSIAAASSVSGITTAVTWRLDIEGEVRAIGAGTSASIACNARFTSGSALSHGSAVVTTFDSTIQDFIDLSFVAAGGSVQAIVVQNANIKIFQ